MSGEFDLLMWPLTCCCHANRLGCERAVLPERSGPGPGSSGSGGSDSRLWQVAGPSPAARSHLEHGKRRRPPAAEKTDTSVHSPTTSQTELLPETRRTHSHALAHSSVWVTFLWKRLWTHWECVRGTEGEGRGCVAPPTGGGDRWLTASTAHFRERERLWVLYYF